MREDRITSPRPDAHALMEHLRKRTTLQLCDDFEGVSGGMADWRRFAARMISDVLFERNEAAWWDWVLAGATFGTNPRTFFMP